MADTMLNRPSLRTGCGTSDGNIGYIYELLILLSYLLVVVFILE